MTPCRPTNRRQFVAWLHAELEKRGERIPVNEPSVPYYRTLREALERQWLKAGEAR